MERLRQPLLIIASGYADRYTRYSSRAEEITNFPISPTYTYSTTAARIKPITHRLNYPPPLPPTAAVGLSCEQHQCLPRHCSLRTSTKNKISCHEKRQCRYCCAENHQVPGFADSNRAWPHLRARAGWVANINERHSSNCRPFAMLSAHVGVPSRGSVGRCPGPRLLCHESVPL